ncbi:hypothetical protein PR202_gb02334 [Eleusine coracana subsp. coracana]|uniref:C2 domain-containing protein n=1 Tax=Eleusine coracana subsp. coracana TaxID=191504 RepID=A0AAV5DZ15_ELECO|nr:hypothetical protein QOZ80_8BG0669670 [Eleusine coracana subsp. coracana]GJN15420.1 hypothetical protein PR202_gb02334 [Eleusine coracana subsp. coracana]
MHRYEVEVTVGSARELKNVNWRHGELKPYVVLWVNINEQDGLKCSTRVDHGENPDWEDEKVLVPIIPPSSIDDAAVLCIDVVHADAGNKEEDVKPLVGSARLPLRDVKVSRTLRLKRPSGRPQGRLDVRVVVRDNPSPYPSPYAQPSAIGTRDAYYGQPAAAPGAGGYGYGAPPQPASYGAPPPPVTAAGYGEATVDPNNKSSGGKMGMGTGLAVGAAAGVLGGLALAGGASYLGDKAADNDYDDDDY